MVMKNMLLEIQPVVIGLIVFVVVGLVAIFYLSKKKNVQEENIKNLDIDVEKNEKYMFLKELSLYEYISSVLPNEYIVFPKVSMSLLVNPTHTKHAYNEIKGKVVDLVIFEKASMMPILVLDCYDTTYANGMLEELEPLIVKVLQKANLEILTLQIKNQLNKDEIKQQILDKLNNDKKI